MSIESRLITDFAELEALAADWDRLWRSDPNRSVFGTFAWARASWRAYGADRRLCTIVLADGAEVVGVLPLAAHDSTLTFLGAPRSDYNDILCAERDSRGIVHAALEAVLEMQSQWTICALENVPEHSRLYTSLPHLTGEVRARLIVTPGSGCPRVKLDPETGEVARAILAKKSLRRHENRLNRLGVVTFRHVEDREQIKALLPELYRLHVGRRELAGDRSLFEDPAARKFYEALADELDPRSSLRFGVLELDGRPVAIHFGFETEGVFVWYKPAFDVDLARYSPGEVLIRRLFEYVAAQRLHCFDFTVGMEDFKLRFANEVRINHSVFVYQRGPRGTGHLLAGRVKERLRRHPRLYHLIKTGATRAQRLVRLG